MAMGNLESMERARRALLDLLERAKALKAGNRVDPPLPTESLVEHLSFDDIPPSAFEVAAQEMLYDYVVYRPSKRIKSNVYTKPDKESVMIESPDFVQVWNLLDILQLLIDRKLCDANAVLSLLEELMDSQTADGCRIAFGYFESRREKLIAKEFPRTSLTILQTCNELLRRLSRAEDAVFCGRVFMFLFQAFPLGDKSSVNLRGVFHTDNINTYEIPDEIPTPNEDSMEIATEEEGGATDAGLGQTPKVAVSGPQDKPKEEVLDDDALYPMFWRLQYAFSNPPSLFSHERFVDFKKGLQATLAKFRSTAKVVQMKGSVDVKEGTKRKRGDSGDELAHIYNPKYLTSRELFELELSDIAFQRHILVQALILIDFLLSLTEKAKKKLANAQKAMLYSFTLGHEDTEWALGMRASIANYLQEGPDGKFYYRMVDTVLSRDKNWVRWKAEQCPPIERPALPTDAYLKARDGAQKVCANRRIRPTPMGSLDLSFLSEQDGVNGLERLKNPDRFRVPAAESLMKDITGIELDLEMAMTDEEKQSLEEAKASKTWRVLRVAARSKLSMFDKIDDGKQLHSLFQPEAGEEAVRAEEATANNDAPGSKVELPVAEPPAHQVQEESRPASQTTIEAADAVVK